MYRRIVSGSYWAVAIIFVWAVAAVAMENALIIPVYHLDGAFQTASSLFRIADGQLPGRDFLPYLGVGIAFLLYPVFALLGSDLAASEFAAHFWTVLASAISIYIIFRLVLSGSHRYIALVAAFGFVVVLNFYPPAGPLLFNESISPGNSLRALRRLFPYVGLFLCYSIYVSSLRPAIKLIGAAFVSGLAVLWSNDASLPTLCGISLVVLYGCVNKEIRFSTAFLFGAMTALFGVLILIATTGGHALELLTYNFIDVRHDQYWYFAPWSDDSRVFTISEVYSKVLVDYFPNILLLPLLIVGAAWKKNTGWVFLCGIGLSLFLGGVLATVGGHKAWYEQSYLMWSYYVLAGFLIVILKYIYNIVVRRIVGISQWRGFLAVGGIYAMPIIAIAFLAATLSSYDKQERSLRMSESHFYEESLGGYLPTSWKEYVALAKKYKNSSSVEEYWGLWSAINKQHGARVDAAIHALGNQRDNFFNSQDIVTTTRREFSVWQAWSFSSNYWLYGELMRFYDVLSVSPTTVVWKKRSGPEFEYQPVGCELTDDNAFRIQSNRLGYHEVELIIDGSNIPSRSLLMVQNNINHAWTGGGYIPLDTKKVIHRFPVRVNENGNYFRSFIRGGEIEAGEYLISCKASYIPFISDEVLAPLDYQTSPEIYSDANWYMGISRHSPIFFVKNSRENTAAFRPGKLVRFSVGETRKIDKVQRSGKFLNVYLTGGTLKAEAMGYPADFKLENKRDELITPEKHTDGNWVEGYARHWCGFFVENTPRHRQMLTAGSEIRLSSGLALKIERIESNPKFINAYCAGAPITASPVKAKAFSHTSN